MPGEWEREPVSEASSDSRADSSSQEMSDIDASGAARRKNSTLEILPNMGGNNQNMGKKGAFSGPPKLVKTPLLNYLQSRIGK